MPSYRFKVEDIITKEGEEKCPFQIRGILNGK